MNIKITDLHKFVGREGRFYNPEADHFQDCHIGYVPKNNLNDRIFWGEADPANVARYIIRLGRMEGQYIDLTDENINRLLVKEDREGFISV